MTTPESRIRILVVDDSPLVRTVLATLLAQDPSLEIVGVAKNGKEAIALVPKLRPNLITMDIHMPEMDGCECTKQIMAYHPTPILIISSSGVPGDRALIFKAIEYGALDVVENTKILNSNSPEDAKQLIERVKTLARITVITHPLAKLEKKSAPAAVVADGPAVVVIASSTGGPQALMTVLHGLPKNFPSAILIVQHISQGFTEGLVEWLNAGSKITVKIALDEAPLQPGIAYVAPSGFHMRVERGKIIRLSDGPPVDGQKPSGTVLFESVAASCGTRAVGLVLSGMGRDGASGAKQLHQSGGHVIAQDEKSCVVFGMPKAAIDLGAVDEVLPLEKISHALMAQVHS